MAAPVTFSEHAEKVLIFNGRHPLVAEHLADMERLYEEARQEIEHPFDKSEFAAMRERAERAEAALAAAQEELRIERMFCLCVYEGSFQDFRLIRRCERCAALAARAAAGGDETA